MIDLLLEMHPPLISVWRLFPNGQSFFRLNLVQLFCKLCGRGSVNEVLARHFLGEVIEVDLWFALSLFPRIWPA